MKRLLCLAFALCLVAAALPLHALPNGDPYNQETAACISSCGAQSYSCLVATGNYGLCHTAYANCTWFNCNYVL